MKCLNMIVDKERNMVDSTMHPVPKADFLYELEVNQSMCRFILKFLMLCLLEDSYSLVLVVFVQMKDLMTNISNQGYRKMYRLGSWKS